MASILDDINANDSALAQAIKLTQKASSVGFDWPDVHGVLAKIEEEMAELFEEVETGTSTERIKAELGDLLFACCNLARHLDIEPEQALQNTNNKFIRRFQYIEQQITQAGQELSACDLATLDEYWEQAKQKEKLT